MRKTLRNKELTMIILCQFHRHMLTVCRRSLADIHGNIQHSTLHTSYLLALGKRRPLEMQASHYPITTHAFVVLAELYLVAHQWLHLLFKLTLTETLKEVATSISKQARLNYEHAFNICLYYFHNSNYKIKFNLQVPAKSGIEYPCFLKKVLKLLKCIKAFLPIFALARR